MPHVQAILCTLCILYILRVCIVHTMVLCMAPSTRGAYTQDESDAACSQNGFPWSSATTIPCAQTSASLIGDWLSLPAARPTVFTVRVNTLWPMVVTFHRKAGPPISGGMISPAGTAESRSGMAASSGFSRIPNASTLGCTTLTCSRIFKHKEMCCVCQPVNQKYASRHAQLSGMRCYPAHSKSDVNATNVTPDQQMWTTSRQECQYGSSRALCEANAWVDKPSAVDRRLF